MHSKSIAVVYLARSEAGSATDFLRFATSYRKHSAGVPHDLVIIHKGASRKFGTREAIAHLFHGIDYTSIDRADDGFDIQAYIDASRDLRHDYVCFLNTYSEICSDDWLVKLLQPLLQSPVIGMAGATASYESIHSSVGLYSKIIWMCSSGVIGYDHRLATAFHSQLSIHAPQWLALRPQQSEVAIHTLAALDTSAVREGFAAHWHAVTKLGGGLWGLDQFKPFPNPHLRSNGFVVRRELFNGFNFKLGNSKLDCIRFESGIDGLPTRIAQLGLESVLVGADGRVFPADAWTDSAGFRLGSQDNVMVTDNQVRAFAEAPQTERQLLNRITWGAYSAPLTPLLLQLGFPNGRGNLRLTHAPRPYQNAKETPLLISIVIPTRNRGALLTEALHTVIAQGYQAWECVVFDNGSDEPLSLTVGTFGDERIRYVRSDSFLPVTDSWNRAIDEAVGDYVTLLGDDDGLTPDFMASVEFIVRAFSQPDFIYTALFQFFHPCVASWEPSGYVADLRYGEFFTGHPDVFLIDPGAVQHAVAGSLDFRRNFAFNVQAFCFAKPFLDGVRLHGKVFHSPFPDYYLANVAMGFGKKIVAAPKPLTFAGVSRKSFGFTLFNNLEEQGTALLATDLLRDPMYQAFSEHVLPGPIYNTNYLITMLHVHARLGEFSPDSVNILRYRRLQIISTMFPDVSDRVIELSETYKAQLNSSELKWTESLAQLATRVAEGELEAVAELKQVRREAAMHGKDATVKQLDIGSFAHLPELFDAMAKGLIGPAVYG